jgi:hypothetical protein
MLEMKPGDRVGLGDLVREYVLRLMVPVAERDAGCKGELLLLQGTLNAITMKVEEWPGVVDSLDVGPDWP